MIEEVEEMRKRRRSGRLLLSDLGVQFIREDQFRKEEVSLLINPRMELSIPLKQLKTSLFSTSRTIQRRTIR